MTRRCRIWPIVALGILAGLQVGLNSAKAVAPVSTDAFDVSNGTVILGNSSFDHDAAQGYDARDVFGGNFTANVNERGDVVFDDTSPNNIVDFIEFRTPSPVTITTFNLFYWGDTATRRELGHFNLYERATPVSSWVLLYSATPPVSVYDPNSPKFGTTYLTGSVSAFAATDYRAEFIRAATNELNYTGERMVELDGFAVPEPATFLLLAGPVLAGLLRRKPGVCRQSR